MKKILIIGLVSSIALVGGSWWSAQNAVEDSSIISTTGIHWHPKLEIYVAGEQVSIPENVGLTGGHSPIHTHDDLPVIHLEFEGVVRHEDIKLQRFFDVWGRDIHEFGTNVTMTVNGINHPELGEYEMHDDDTIVLRYE